MLRAALVSGVALAAATPAPAVDVALDVTFKLTDLDYKPLAGVPARVVFGSEPNWQNPNAGHRFVTDAKGEAHFSAQVDLEEKMKKVPTNFVGSLVSGPQQTDHLAVVAELEFADFHWLYVADLFRFRQGDTLTEGLSVYTPDERGRFVHKAEYDGHGWKMRDLKGLMLTHPGYDLGDFTLAPDPADASGKRWMLKLAFKKSPPPVRR